MVFDVTKLDFCYSECVKVLMSFSQDPSCRPPLQFIISKSMWQVTSLKAMVRFSPSCTVITEVEAAGTTYCCHTNTKEESDSHFAPTGKGVMTTKVVCVGCGHVVSEEKEYFD